MKKPPHHAFTTKAQGKAQDRKKTPPTVMVLRRRRLHEGQRRRKAPPSPVPEIRDKVFTRETIRERRKKQSNAPRGKRRPQASPLPAKRLGFRLLTSHLPVSKELSSLATSTTCNLQRAATAPAPCHRLTNKRKLNTRRAPKPSTQMGWMGRG